MANVTSDEFLFTIAENMKACPYQPHISLNSKPSSYMDLDNKVWQTKKRKQNKIVNWLCKNDTLVIDINKRDLKWRLHCLWLLMVSHVKIHVKISPLNFEDTNERLYWGSSPIPRLRECSNCSLLLLAECNDIPCHYPAWAQLNLSHFLIRTILIKTYRLPTLDPTKSDKWKT